MAEAQTNARPAKERTERVNLDLQLPVCGFAHSIAGAHTQSMLTLTLACRLFSTPLFTGPGQYCSVAVIHFHIALTPAIVVTLTPDFRSLHGQSGQPGTIEKR